LTTELVGNSILSQ